MRIRIVPTFSGKHTVQVVSKRLGKLTIHKHIGTFVTEEQKRHLLKEAKTYITFQTGQQELFDPSLHLRLKNVLITQSQPLFLYRLLCGIYEKLGFGTCSDPLVRDLIVARIYKPSSKRETREILQDLFGVNYSLITIYRHLKKAVDNGLKERFQTALISFAKAELGDSLRLVFYDVTTLAFDSQAKRGLKDFGFSKDHRFGDVQIVVGLVVNRQGFPLYFDVFNGKVFEGKTFLSVVENIRNLLKNPDLIVIADATMISRINIEELDKRNIGFIVGARLANISIEKAFRITKSDLEARPVFLRLDKTITCHLVIVFAGLAICRFLEMRTSLSIQKTLKIADKVLTHTAINAQTGETGLIQTTIMNHELKEKIDLLNSLGH